MFIKKSRYEDLLNDVKHYKIMADHWEHDYRDESSAHESTKNELNALKKKNEELQHQIDILYQYYDLMKEPTQEERTKIRLDLRVHELEMENVDLKAKMMILSDNYLHEFQLRQSIMNAYFPYGIVKPFA